MVYIHLPAANAIGPGSITLSDMMTHDAPYAAVGKLACGLCLGQWSESVVGVIDGSHVNLEGGANEGCVEELSVSLGQLLPLAGCFPPWAAACRSCL